jgi:hypothetical protein
MAGLLRGILQKYEVGGSIAVAGLPLLILLITKFKGGDAESAVNALVLPDADMHRALPKFVCGLAARSGGVVGRFWEGRSDCIMAIPRCWSGWEEYRDAP